MLKGWPSEIQKDSPEWKRNSYCKRLKQNELGLLRDRIKAGVAGTA